MPNDGGASKANTVGMSHNGRELEPPKSEADDLKLEAAQARLAVAETLEDLAASLREATDIREWTRRHPWAAAGVAAAAGFAAAAAIVPSASKVAEAKVADELREPDSEPDDSRSRRSRPAKFDSSNDRSSAVQMVLSKFLDLAIIVARRWIVSAANTPPPASTRVDDVGCPTEPPPADRDPPVADAR